MLTSSQQERWWAVITQYNDRGNLQCFFYLCEDCTAKSLTSSDLLFQGYGLGAFRFENTSLERGVLPVEAPAESGVFWKASAIPAPDPIPLVCWYDYHCPNCQSLMCKKDPNYSSKPGLWTEEAKEGTLSMS